MLLLRTMKRRVRLYNILPRKAKDPNKANSEALSQPEEARAGRIQGL